VLGITRGLVACLLYHLRFWHGAARLCRLVDGHPLLAVFTFHRVLDAPPPETYLQGYERGQSLSSFMAQIESIQRLFDITTLEEFLNILAGRKQPGRRPAALLTFDDADAVHGRVAFAALRDRGLPAVSFVPPGFIESGRRFYHLRLTNICNHLSASDWAKVMETRVPTEVREIVVQHLQSNAVDRRALRRRLIPSFHAMDVETRDRLLDDWERFTPAYTLGIECARWDEIRAWESQGIDIGSHTVNHHRLSLLDANASELELRLSRMTLRERLQGKIKAVSYPEGSYTDAVPELAQKAGYEVGFTTEPGFIRAPVTNAHRYLLPRISISGDSHCLAAYSMGRLILRHLAQAFQQRLSNRHSPHGGSRRRE